jgi:RimJ/RimL family protein N-acetyltransferase
VIARITRLAESDWRIFAVMRLRALVDALGERDPQYQKEVAFTAAQWRRRLRDHAQFAAVAGDRVIGLIAAQQENSESVYLYSLWLDPAARGQGLARSLVGTAVDWARDQHVRSIRLRVASGNVAARAVYESLGFAVATETADHSDELAMNLSVS